MAHGLCLTQYLSQAQIWKESLTDQHSEGYNALQCKNELMYIPCMLVPSKRKKFEVLSNSVK